MVESIVNIKNLLRNVASEFNLVLLLKLRALENFRCTEVNMSIRLLAEQVL